MLFGRVTVGDFRLLAVNPDKIGLERVAVRGDQDCLESPVFAGREGPDFAFTVHHKSNGDRLNSSCGKPGPDLAPEQRAQGVAD